ncbi:MAG TPA: OmpH family outer membrane protein [Acidobacteriota bacterium]|nr:OmpH family outer membrane protein [Acidobacteriota bacterium]
MKAIVVTVLSAAVLTVLAALIIPSVAGSAQEAAPVKIGVIDLQEIANRSEIGQETQKRVRDFFETTKANLDQKEMGLQNESTALENQRAVLAADAYSRKKNELEQRMLQLRQEQENAEAELDNLRQGELDRFANVVGPVIEAVGKELRFTVIIDRRNGVYYFDESTDITEVIVQRLDQAKSGTK